MSSIYLDTSDHHLPTLDKLNASVARDVDAKAVAAAWLKSFASCAESGDVQGAAELFIDDSFWRDLLAMTWDFRTFGGITRIREFLDDRFAASHLRAFRLKDDFLELQQPYPDLAWIQARFEFEADTGACSGIIRLVPTASGAWKCYGMFTNLEELRGFPEKTGHLRNPDPNHGRWESERRREVAFTDGEPTVLIAGGGQAGLDLAARLKCLGVPTLIIEKNARIGDNWRTRYEALCLHDPVHYDHLPYLSFPPTWPVYTPALKLANWLESYAETMELNIWTTSTVASATQDASGVWHVSVKRADGHERIFKVKHLVFAAGLGSGDPNMPAYPGMDAFKGTILHSTQHKRARDHLGKKVVVVGACTAGQDIAVDYCNHGVDVTMYQRSPIYVRSMTSGISSVPAGIYSEDGPPTDIADRISASLCNLMRVPIAQRQVIAVEEADTELLDGMRKRGFLLNRGYKGTGNFLLAWDRPGGYYPDAGGCKLITEGKIKLKSDSQIARFTERGIAFTDGSELPADVVLFATGLGDARGIVRRVCGPGVAAKCSQIWGLNEEGEVKGAWRDLGVPGLWYMMGNLMQCRFHSKHVALQIKAMEEGLFGPRYSL